MRKVKIDSYFLGLFSKSNVSLFLFFGKVPIVRSISSFGNGKTKQFCIKPLSNRNGVLERNNFFGVKKMEEDCNYSDIFLSEENLRRRSSTFEDVQIGISLLKEILECRNKNISSWIIEVGFGPVVCIYYIYTNTHIHRNLYIHMYVRVPI